MTPRLRDLRPGERTTVQAVFDGLSDASRERRFHGPVQTMTPRMLDALSAADGQDHVVVVAEVGWGPWRRPVGLARLVRTGHDTAELAVEVVDAAQGRGVGRRLVEITRARAMALGYRVVEADVLEENEAMLHLLRDAYVGIEAMRSRGVWHLRCPVPSTSFETADLYPLAVAVA
jgi:RimJ/RimL family protein N-acetyltransferase